MILHVKTILFHDILLSFQNGLALQSPMPLKAIRCRSYSILCVEGQARHESMSGGDNELFYLHENAYSWGGHLAERKRKTPNATLQSVLSILTGGPWGPGTPLPPILPAAPYKESHTGIQSKIIAISTFNELKWFSIPRMDPWISKHILFSWKEDKDRKPSWI